MTEVFLLHHTYGESESETYKLLGVFSSEEAARIQMEKARTLPGFKDYPNGFSINKYMIDRAFWVDGFGFEDGDDIEES